MFANFNRFSALTESSFRVSSSSSRTWKSEDGYLDGKEGEASGFRSLPRLHVLARRRLIGRWVASARLTVPPSSSCEIKKDRTRKPRFSSISTLCSSPRCTIRAKLERPPFEIPIFSHFFFPLEPESISVIPTRPRRQKERVPRAQSI